MPACSWNLKKTTWRNADVQHYATARKFQIRSVAFISSRCRTLEKHKGNLQYLKCATLHCTQHATLRSLGLLCGTVCQLTFTLCPFHFSADFCRKIKDIFVWTAISATEKFINFYIIEMDTLLLLLLLHNNDVKLKQQGSMYWWYVFKSSRHTTRFLMAIIC